MVLILSVVWGWRAVAQLQGSTELDPYEALQVIRPIKGSLKGLIGHIRDYQDLFWPLWPHFSFDA